MFRDGRPDDSEALAKVSLETFRATYRGVADDDAWLDALSEDYFKHEWDKQLTIQAKRDLGPVVVSEVDGRLVGFATGRWVGDADLQDPEWRDRFVELMELYVLPDFQGKPPRHGTKLLLELHQRMDASKWVVGHVAAGNERARKFMRTFKPQRESEIGQLGLGQGVMVKRVTFIYQGPKFREEIERRAAELG